MNRKQLADQPMNGAMARYQGMPSAAPIAGDEPAPNILGIIWRQRWMVLGITILFVAAAVAFLKLVPPSYTAMTSLSIDSSTSLTKLPGDPSGVLPDGFYYRVAQILQSHTIADAAAKELEPTASADELDRFSNTIRNNVNVDVGRRDNIITISYTDKDPELASKIANAVQQAYIDYVTESRSDTNHKMYDTLVEEKKKYDAELRSEQNAEIDFKKNHPDLYYLNPTNGQNQVSQEITKLFDARTTAELELAKARAIETAASSAKDDPERLRKFALSQRSMAGGTGAAAGDGGEMGRVEQSLQDAEMRVSLLQTQYGPNSPFIKRDLALIEELKAKLALLSQQYVQTYLDAVHNDVVQAEANVKAYQQAIVEAEKNAAPLNSSLGDYEKLDNEVQATQKLIDTLDAQVKAIEVDTVVGHQNITVVDSARAEDATRTPQPGRVLLLMLAMGLVSGSGVAVLRDKLDQRVRTPEEIAALLGLPVIGAVPHMKSGLTELARAQAVHWDPMSDVAEAYRAVRTAIHFGVPAGQAKTIVVTSPTPSDGKSTLASNLAICMAQAGKRTLLLDADFRRSVQHKMFEIKEETGLTSVLAGHDSLSNAIYRTVVEGLDLLPAGPPPLNPSELLNGESFAAIIEELSQKYDHVVLDCPPVVAVTDARILGAVCDLSVLVLRARKTTRRGAEMARAGLLSVGSRLLGVVVNDVSRGEEHYGYYDTYRYQAGYSQRRMVDGNGEETNGSKRRRLPSPSGIDGRE